MKGEWGLPGRPGRPGQDGSKGIKGPSGMSGRQGPKGQKGRLIHPPESLIRAEKGQPGDEGNKQTLTSAQN